MDIFGQKKLKQKWVFGGIKFYRTQQNRETDRYINYYEKLKTYITCKASVNILLKNSLESLKDNNQYE